MTDPAGDTTEVRDEDRFDAGAVHAWLAAHVGGFEGLALAEVRQFPGGASNLTYLLRYPGRELVLRRPPAGHKAASAHDMSREFRVQRQLAPWFPLVPQVIALCEDPAVIGSPFYVMTRIPGMILRRQVPEGVVLSPDDAGALAMRAFDCLLRLHRVDPVAAGLADLGRGGGYVGRQVAGWTERYRRARTPKVGTFENVMAWLARHQPPDSGICLIHNDFRLDNLVLDDQLSVAGVLDWEMATLGDPLMDLGGALAYWMQADDDPVLLDFAMQPSDLPGMPTRGEILDRYLAASGQVIRDWVFYEVFGLFRLAGILQQIFWRYYHRETTNPAFAEYWVLVNRLEERCAALCGVALHRPTADPRS